MTGPERLSSDSKPRAVINTESWTPSHTIPKGSVSFEPEERVSVGVSRLKSWSIFKIHSILAFAMGTHACTHAIAKRRHFRERMLLKNVRPSFLGGCGLPDMPVGDCPLGSYKLARVASLHY